MNQSKINRKNISDSLKTRLNCWIFFNNRRLFLLKILIIQTSLTFFSYTCYSQSFDSSFCTTAYLPYGPTGNSMQNIGIGTNSAIQANGKIIVAIDVSDPYSNNTVFCTYRYNTDGTPDQSFGTNGVFSYYVGQNARNKDVMVQEDGKIVIVGESEYCVGSICGPPEFLMMRLNPNGVLDSTFGLDGVLKTLDLNINPGYNTLPVRVFKVANSKYIIAGNRAIKLIGGKAFVARLNYNGSYDLSFGDNGIFTDTSSSARLRDIALDINGSIFGVLEEFHTGDTVNNSDTKIFKINSSGILDNTFGNGGRVVINVSNIDRPTSIAIRADKKIVVVGTSDPIYNSWVYAGNIGYVLILNENGSASSIYPQGYRTFKLPKDSSTYFNKVVIADGDNMMICGKVADVITNFHEKALIYMLKSDGNPDNAFNNNGYMILDYGFHSNIGSINAFNDLDILPGGMVLATGVRNIAANLTRYLFLLKLKDVIASPENINSINLVKNVNFSPNPFKVAGHLDYELLQTNTISIELFDIMGQLIYKFCNNEKRNPGFHSENILKPSICKEGIYFLILRTSSGSITQKLVIK